MKKILIASTLVGTAAAGLIMYLAKKGKAQRLIDRSAGVVEDTVDNLRNKFMDNVDRPQNNMYSSAMG